MALRIGPAERAFDVQDCSKTTTDILATIMAGHSMLMVTPAHDRSVLTKFLKSDSFRHGFWEVMG